MRFEHDGFPCACLKDQTVQEEAHACSDRMVIKMFPCVLKEIGRRGKTMASLMCGIKRDTWKRFSWLQLIMFAEHMRGFLDQMDRFLANSIIVARLRPFSFWQEAQHVTDARRLIFRSWWGIIDELNKTIRGKVQLK